MYEFVLGGVTFPLTPERVTLTKSAQVKTWDVLDLGEITFPRGRQATRVNFSFVLPGATRQDLPFVTAWQDPFTIYNQFSAWLEAGTSVRFVVTETGISLPVFIQSLTGSPGGGYGDIDGQMTLCEQRSLTITTGTPTTTPTAGGTPINPYRPQVVRSVPNTPATYTTQPGDTLWSLAKLQLGDGSLWQQLAQANIGTLGAHPNAGAPLPPGTQLVLPGGS